MLESEKDQLIEGAQKRNSEAGITGVLFMSDHVFLQTVEGEAKVLRDLLEVFYTATKKQRLSRDPRHYQMVLTKVEQIDTRQYPDWAMEPIKMSPEVFGIMSHLLSCLTTSYDTLKTYTQKSVIQTLRTGVDPIRMKPKAVSKIIFFADIVGYSAISSCLTPTENLEFVNSFLKVR